MQAMDMESGSSFLGLSIAKSRAPPWAGYAQEATDVGCSLARRSEYSSYRQLRTIRMHRGGQRTVGRWWCDCYGSWPPTDVAERNKRGKKNAQNECQTSKLAQLTLRRRQTQQRSMQDHYGHPKGDSKRQITSGNQRMLTPHFGPVTPPTMNL